MEGYLPAYYSQLIVCTLQYNAGLGEALDQITTLSVCGLQLRRGRRGYSCYTSIFTHFTQIYWTCLIGLGGKSHRSCNLAHTVRDLD